MKNDLSEVLDLVQVFAVRVIPVLADTALLHLTPKHDGATHDFTRRLK